MDATTQTRPRFFYLSHPRTASNLVMRMLSFQPKLRQGEYYFVGKMSMLVENDESMATDEIQREEWLPKYQKGFDLFQDFVHSFDRGDGSLNRIENVSQSERPASGGEVLIYKDHVLLLLDPSLEIQHTYNVPRPEPWSLCLNGETAPPKIKTNPTMLPDSFFDGWKPFMIIRHPALTFPSFFRVSKEAWGSTIHSRWVVQGNSYWPDKIMYDWYRKRLENSATEEQKNGDGISWPLIVDMQEILNHQPTMEKFCLALELEPQHIRYEWKPASKEHLENQNSVYTAFLSSPQNSAGILPEKAPKSVSLEAEYSKWVEEWGREISDVLRKQVEDAMEDYNYLRSKRMV